MVGNLVKKKLNSSLDIATLQSLKNKPELIEEYSQIIIDEVHHIQEQKKANKDGFIGHINANHKYNLIPLCKLHHKMVHDGKINVNGFVATSKGLELHYTMIEE